MKKRFWVGIFSIFSLVLFFLASVTRAQTPYAIITEWATPGNPFQISASNGVSFFIETVVVNTLNVPKIGRIESETNVLTEWELPFWPSSPGDIAVQTDSLGNQFVWVTDLPNTQIGRLDPATNTFTEWAIPVIGGPRDFAIDASGNIFFSVWNSTIYSRIGRLSPETDTITLWDPPSDKIEDLAIDPSGNVFFTIIGATSPSSNNKIGMLDPATDEITEWLIPNTPYFAIDIDTNGNIFFWEIGPSPLRKIARLVPSTNTLTEWDYSGNSPEEFITVDPSGRAFLAKSPNEIIMLDPSIPGIDDVLTPTIPTTAPSTGGVVVVPTVNTYSPTTSTITPTVTIVPGIEDGAITEWTLPVANSYPRGISADQLGNVFFSEQGPNYAIGRLNVNRAPVLDFIGTQWVNEQQGLTFLVNGEDPDGDSLTFSASDLPPRASFDPSTRTFDWTTNESDAGTYFVTFSVSDGNLTDSELVQIYVWENNDGGAGPIKKKREVIKIATETQQGGIKVRMEKVELDTTFAIEVTFNNVVPAEPTVRVTTFDSCPNMQNIFQIGNACFDITTNADSFTSVEICVDDPSFNSNTQMQHYEGHEWVDVTTSRNLPVICGSLTSLSPISLTSNGIRDVIAPSEPQQALIDEVHVTANFIGVSNDSTHTAVIDWGDGNVTEANVDEQDGSGVVSGSYFYNGAGVYEITVKVTDESGNNAQSTFRYLVVFDTDGGFVTGGGWIDSPSGAYMLDESLTGKASFGFVSKYKKGAEIPTGNTEFQFQTADLNFHSSSYDWLVVNQGGTNAQFKGVGTINGMGDYRFMLWAGDDETDTFRIKIWEEHEFGVETVIYDNGFDQEISGGSIMVHVGK